MSNKKKKRQKSPPHPQHRMPSLEEMFPPEAIKDAEDIPEGEDAKKFFQTITWLVSNPTEDFFTFGDEMLDKIYLISSVAWIRNTVLNMMKFLADKHPEISEEVTKHYEFTKEIMQSEAHKKNLVEAIETLKKIQVRNNVRAMKASMEGVDGGEQL
jgi:hypothetical protein